MNHSHFANRHIGPSQHQIPAMLKSVGANSLSDLVQKATPKSILLSKELDLPEEISEYSFLKKARATAKKNKVYKSYIGMGYYPAVMPSVIQRSILENPSWYTAYTPYQSEISQGRMEALLNFQTMVCEITGMEMANSSLLDEGTAVAEAMVMAQKINKKSKSHKFLVSPDVFPQTLEILQTRSEPVGIELVVAPIDQHNFAKEPVFGVFLQYPSASGGVKNAKDLVEIAHQNQAYVVVATDLMALQLYTPPGEWGADIVVGSSQRFGVSMGYGGPHAAFLACRDEHKRSVPGRIIGVSKDAQGKAALRLALQTREQHIRRDKATSNICTAQVLLAVLASMYAVYHGPEGLQQIARRIHNYTHLLFTFLKKKNFSLTHSDVFDTLELAVSSEQATEIKKRSLNKEANLAYFDKNKNWTTKGKEISFVRLSLNERTHLEDVEELAYIVSGETTTFKEVPQAPLAPSLQRATSSLTHPIFNLYHSETEMMRYIYRLEKKDLSLTHSMIPLGSCTMKLNAASEMFPITWPEFADLHPFAPLDQAQGYQEVFQEIEKHLVEITGYDAISLQPNAGSQGEYAGLLVIRKYHQSQGQNQRTVCLIPSSAHGTNPASAVMAGFEVKVVACDDQGNIDIEDLKSKASENKDRLGALMITYPSTHGVFEESIREICQIIHDNGGQVYLDGANLNAMVGVAKPGQFGSDVSHLNLHKTFSIPHGGGGPGVGPIGVAPHLTPYLPSHSVVPCATDKGISAVSAAPWGSAGILPISWGYLLMLGREGVKKASQVAILNANYIAKRLEPHFPILYKGSQGYVAHECIIDLRPFKEWADVNDVAKRLMDYGFHSPTMSWPVAGTLMIEPTESESLEELDRFCEAMIEIRKEIDEISNGTANAEDNVLKNAPHTVEMVTSDQWPYSYTREKAAYPLPYLKERKFWTSVARVDNAYGDKNLVCSCPPLDSYQ